MEEEDAAFAFVLDKVVSPGGELLVDGGGEAADQGFDGALYLVV